MQRSCIYGINYYMRDKRCDVIQTLENVGLNKTPHRRTVLEILINTDRPLSASDVLKRNFGKKKINKVTVYRILSTFKKEGIIREVPNARGIKHYEMACRHNPIHPHFHCSVCKTMTCLSPLTLSNALEWFAKPYDFIVEDISVNITGVCNRCRGKE